MPRYGPKASEKVEEAVHKQKRGQLRSGSGRKVKSQRQAVAIGLSEARKEGAKVPPKKGSSSATKKSGSKSSGSGKKSGSKKKTARKQK